MSFFDDAVADFEEATVVRATHLNFKDLLLDQMIEVDVNNWREMEIKDVTITPHSTPKVIQRCKVLGRLQGVVDAPSELKLFTKADAPFIDFSFIAGTQTARKLAIICDNINDILTVCIWKRDVRFSDKTSGEVRMFQAICIAGVKPDGQLVSTFMA